jgi:hypothetical protein
MAQQIHRHVNQSTPVIHWDTHTGRVYYQNKYFEFIATTCQLLQQHQHQMKSTFWIPLIIGLKVRRMFGERR